MTTRAAEKLIATAIGTVCATIAVALIVFLVWLYLASPTKSGSRETAAMVTSFVVPFAILFTAFGWAFLVRSVGGRSEMYSATGWRVLAGLCAFVGIACTLVAGPLAILVPGATAAVLLVREEWIQAFLFGQGNQ